MPSKKDSTLSDKLLSLALSLAGQMTESTKERELQRFGVFNRAWEIASTDQRVALAQAFLRSE